MGSLRNRKLKNRIRQQTPQTQDWKLAFFSITDENINQVARLLSKPRDCVINAMELLKIVDNNAAAIMRILVGEQGIMENQIVDMFSFVFKRPFRISTLGISDVFAFLNFLNNDAVLPRSNAVFLGIRYNNGDGHVFIIGKTNQGFMIYLDPQNPNMCNLNDPGCIQTIFGNARSIITIEYSDYASLNVSQPVPMTDVSD